MDGILGDILAALYLRGLPRSAQLPAARWRQVESALLRSPYSAPAEALQAAGLWLEAGVLLGEGLLEAARAVRLSGRCLTPADDAYPQRWRRFPFAPPALWQAGAMPAGEFFTVVGSRQVGPSAARFARQAGAAIAAAGGVLVSGGAQGIDREAARGAASVLEILPYGIGRLAHRPKGCVLSLAAPDELFTAALAMERNALLYAASERSLVVAARFREGGTWSGATAALRRGLSSIFVRQDGSLASRAFIALGAGGVSDPAALLQAPPPGLQMGLPVSA